MADEAYRAVFLRVHPTGKMVLSLTTESDGKEGRVRAARGRRAGSPCARRQGRSGRHGSLRHRSRLQHQPERRHPGRDRRRRREDPRQGAAARRRGARDGPGDPRVGQRRLGRRRRRRPDAGQDDRGAGPVRARDAAPCRPESRAGSTRRPSTGTDRRSGVLPTDALRADEQEDEARRHDARERTPCPERRPRRPCRARG